MLCRTLENRYAFVSSASECQLLENTKYHISNLEKIYKFGNWNIENIEINRILFIFSIYSLLLFGHWFQYHNKH